ncbi:MAG: Na+/H+ antiporter NhaC family protein [Planctomycetota bacterium]
MAEPGWIALVPTLCVVAVALVLRTTIPALVIGVVVGHLMLDGPGFVGGLADSLVGRLGNRSEAWALAVCGVFGMLIRLLVVTGGANAFGRLVGGRVASGRAALLLAWFLGLVVFIDDYVNALVLGRTLRPVTDMHRVPRERLAYVIDSTAAPMCLLVPISTWAVYVAGLLESTGAAQPGAGVSAYLRIIPFAFYGWFAILLVPLVSLGWIPAWGAMRRADDRVAAGGSVAPPGSPPADEPPAEAAAASARLADFLLPIVTLVVATVLSHNDALQGGIWAIGMVAAQQLLWRRRFSIAALAEAGCQGLADMVPVLVTLLLAFMLGRVNERLELAEFVIGALGPWLDHRLLPAAAFVCLSAVSFATGSFWGTYAIALPIVIPLAESLGADPPLAIAAVVSAGGFGSHACFFGDTTIMTSQASGCENLAHAWSQLPYALLAAGLSVVAFLVAGLL